MIEVVFVGDTCFNGTFAEKLKSGTPIFSSEIFDYLKHHEFGCCNFEGSETSEVIAQKQGTPLKNGQGAVTYLSNHSFNIFNLANNHICDYGKAGLQDTVKLISDAKQSYVGAGFTKNEALQPVILKKEGKSLAIIAFSEDDGPMAGAASYGVAGIRSFRKLSIEIDKLKQQHNWVVFMYHGGEEFSIYPSPQKRKLLQKIASKTKVDAIVAHHSHTFQGVELIYRKPIFYSLGNFVFDLENHEIFPHTNESAMVSITFSDNGIGYIFYPTVCNSNSGTICKGSIEFLEEIKRRSNFDDYKLKWRKECYRLVFQRPIHNTLNPEGKSLQKQSVVKILFSLKFYSQIIHILKNEKLRNMYLNAFCHKITNRL